MDVDDLRELLLIPIDSEIEINEEGDLQRSDSLLCRFSDVYDVQKVLGAGSYGVVAEVTEI